MVLSVLVTLLPREIAAIFDQIILVANLKILFSCISTSKDTFIRSTAKSCFLIPSRITMSYLKKYCDYHVNMTGFFCDPKYLFYTLKNILRKGSQAIPKSQRSPQCKKR